MNAEKMIKTEARAMLSKRWPAAVMALFMLIFVPMIAAVAVMTAYDILGDADVRTILETDIVKALLFALLHVVAVVALVMLAPVYNGFVRFYAKTACGEDSQMSDVFYFFETKQRYKNAVVYMAGVLVRCLGILIVCEALALATVIFSSGRITTDARLKFIAIAFAAIGGICAFLWMHRFALQMMLFSYYDYDAVSAANEGMRAARGNIGKLIKLSVSFIPWMFSTPLMIPLMYVCPYMTCAYFVSAKYIINGYLEAKNAEPAQPAAVPAEAPAPETEEEQPETSAAEAPDSADETEEQPENTDKTAEHTENNENTDSAEDSTEPAVSLEKT